MRSSSGPAHKVASCGGPSALLPDANREEFAALHSAVTSDWGPRDAYERRWVMELVTAMLRQDHLRRLELATLAAAESPPSEATMRKLDTYARYGARIDKDIGRALQALRVLRKRSDEWTDELRDGTSEPAETDAATRNFTNEMAPCTSEPKAANGNLPACTSEPEPPVPNRRERRRLAALVRKRRAA